MRSFLFVVLLAMCPMGTLAEPKPDAGDKPAMAVDLVQDLHWQDHHFVMTNWFYGYKRSDPAAQVALLAERGYKGVMLSLKDDPGRWKQLPAYLDALKKHKMHLTAIHVRFYIEDGTYPQVIKDNLPLLKDSKVVLIPSVGSRKKADRRDPDATAAAVKILREMSDDAKKFGLGGIAPYMHIGNWVETIDDNIRIAKLVDRRNVGVMFHLHHWQAVGNRDQAKLREDLIKAMPYLMTVVVQGTDNDQASHKIVGEGTFDLTPLVKTLSEMGYEGPLGTMGYTQKGDIPGKLDRAYKAWEAIKQQARLSAADHKKQALVFLIAGQSNAAGVAAFSPETNKKAGMHDKHPTIPGSTAVEVGIPVKADAYPRSYIWNKGIEQLTPGKNLKAGYRDPNRHGIELPLAMLLEKQHPYADIVFIKHGPPGHNLHTQWKAGTGQDYKAFLGQYKAALADLDKRYDRIRVLGMYWDQGESDEHAADAYADNLRDLFKAFRADLGQPELPIFVRKLIFQHGNDQFAKIIRAQEAIAEVDEHAYLLDLNLGSNEKNFKAWAWTDQNGHLSSKAYLELAKRLLKQADNAPDERADYLAIAQAYADFMIEHGRDIYGEQHTPLFVTGLDRKTGKKISPPFAHVKRKPFMPSWERDRELRRGDRNHGHADPLDQLTLLKLMHKLTELTGEQKYADEADKTVSWWLANTQSPIGLYPWGTHTYWNVDKESGGGTFEFNHVWPYWDLNKPALHRYAHGLWDHVIRDKNTGDFNRHSQSHRHGPGGGMEFPWPGSAMIATWSQAYLDKPDPEYLRAIETVLDRWESLRDDNGHLAPCSKYGEWAWYLGYMQAANRLDDFADKLQDKQPKLAEKMRVYGKKNDAAYLSVANGLLDIKRVGPVKSYLRETGGYNPERLDIIGGPWQDRKDYAGFAVMLHERMKRNDNPALQKRYRVAVLDTAELYMSINPEVQWAVWGENMANAIYLMLAAHELTDNTAYLHRADHFAQLAVKLFLDDTSPLPKLTSQDNYYEIESVTTPSTDVWMLAAMELQQRLSKLRGANPQPIEIKAANGVWDCTQLAKPASSVLLSYGEDETKSLFLSRRETLFQPSNDKGLPIDGLDLILSDHVNRLPTFEEVKPFNGPYRGGFTGKHREPSTATYGGFKDVLVYVELLLHNRSDQPVTVTINATQHDSWDDREAETIEVRLGPGESKTVKCEALDKRFIRRVDLDGEGNKRVVLERFTFRMEPRSRLNP